MRELFPRAIIENYEHLVKEMKKHPRDRHVLAAAVASNADYVVTFNLKDFVPGPADSHSIAVIGPSTFLKELTIRDREVIEQRLREQAVTIGLDFRNFSSASRFQCQLLCRSFESHDCSADDLAGYVRARYDSLIGLLRPA